MDFKIIKTDLSSISQLRTLFLWESNFQFTYNKCHENNWADTWLFTVNGQKAGYGAIWGSEKREDRDSIFEFYLTRPFRKLTNLFFEEFTAVSNAKFIECQSNDKLLCSMLYEYAPNINAEAILFEDDLQTNLTLPDVIFYRESSANHNSNDVGDYFLKKNGEVVASGGFMLNYNKPYADVYMEVKEPFRKMGFGSFIVQELKKEIYLVDRIPSARCNTDNLASKATLLKAGFKICGARLKGVLK